MFKLWVEVIDAMQIDAVVDFFDTFAQNFTSMNYQETLQHLFSQLPMYQRVGKAAYKANLNNTLALDEYFSHPHKHFKTIHVAGTNGKGSTSHMLCSILMEAGYRVGLYTSPHLIDFRERIKVNGQNIGEQEVVDFVEENMEIFERIKPSFFEMTVALAFKFFADQKVDVAVIEVGLGGRLDSTNIIEPDLSIITNIGLDHTDLLGDTLQKIAIEKAGIIKPNTPIVVSELQPEVENIFTHKAKSSYAPIVFAESLYKVSKLENSMVYQSVCLLKADNGLEQCYKLDLHGGYQSKNTMGVLAATDQLVLKGYRICQNHIEQGLMNVISNTGIMGRWQTLSRKPLTICDTGHNVDGITYIVKQISHTPHSKLHMVFGMVGDKDIDAVLKLLPKDATYYFTRPSIPRAMAEDILAAKAEPLGLKGEKFPNVKSALEAATLRAKANDLIFVGGSTFTVADALQP